MSLAVLSVAVMASCACNTERSGPVQLTPPATACPASHAERSGTQQLTPPATACPASRAEQPGTQQLTPPAAPAACRLELDRQELLRRSHDCLGLATLDAPAHDDPFTLEPPPGYMDRGHHDKEVRPPLRPWNTPNSKHRGLGQHSLS